MLHNCDILVTGGAGFIGSALVEYFLAHGNRVVCLDNFSTGKRENIEPFFQNPAFRLLEGDIRDSAICESAANGAQYIFHEAALGSVPRSIGDPLTTVSVNDSGFVNMLNAARHAKVRRFVYASSSSVYGDSTVSPKKEESTGNVLSPYAATKAADELYAGVFHRVYGLDCVGLRYFNVFGRRQDPAGPYAAVIPVFFSKLLNHVPPVINGDGTNSRDFTYVDNIVKANMLAASAGTEISGEVFNAACGNKTTLMELFEYLRELVAEYDPSVCEIEPVFGPPRAGDIPYSLADISKSEKMLGYTPDFSVREGLKLASRWYHENL